MAATSGRSMPYGTGATSAPFTNASTRSIGARRENVQPETTSAPVNPVFLPGCSSAPKKRSPVTTAFARSRSAATSGMNHARVEQLTQAARKVHALARRHFVAGQQQEIAAGRYDAAVTVEGGVVTAGCGLLLLPRDAV